MPQLFLHDWLYVKTFSFGKFNISPFESDREDLEEDLAYQMLY